VAGGIAYAGSDDQHLYALNAKSDPRRLGVPGRRRGRVRDRGGRRLVYFGSIDNNLYAVGA
jgi:PQQ-like domain